MILSTELISAQSEQIEKFIISRSRLDSTISFRTPMFLSTDLISARSDQFLKIDHLRSQPVASEHLCFLVQN